MSSRGALRRAQVLEADAGPVEVVQHRRDARPLALGVVRVGQLAAAQRELEVVRGESGGDRGERLLQLQRQLLPAEAGA